MSSSAIRYIQCGVKTPNTGLLATLGTVRITVEPPNKGHFGGNNFVPCREVVPISEVNNISMGSKQEP